MIKSTLKKDSNSVLAFCDNSSATNGYGVNVVYNNSINNSIKNSIKNICLDIVLTAETHNFPHLFVLLKEHLLYRRSYKR